MNEINLNYLKLKTFTEQNASDYCQINNINSNDIKTLVLNNNELTDISGIKIFKNLEKLNLAYNKINNISDIENLINLKVLYLNSNPLNDISVIKNLNNLKYLNIDNLELGLDQIKYINSIKNLEELFCYKGFKDMTVINQLNKNIEIIK